MIIAPSSGMHEHCRTSVVLPPPAPSRAACDLYSIYCLRHRTTGRPYVGLTKRPLDVRVAAHVSQARRKRRVRPGGLLDAIREADATGLSFARAFTATILEGTVDIETARTLERIWIDRLQAQQPTGYNQMPGGASVGGPANARAIGVDLPGGEQLRWPSIDAAIRACNEDRTTRGLAPLLGPAVYMRLQAGWSSEAALGLVARADGRGLRCAPITVGGREFYSVKAVSELTGVSTGAIRSRLHRAGSGTAEIGQDRRHLPGQRRADLIITCPKTGRLLTPTSFARFEGLPKSTVLHRWHQALGAGVDISDEGALCDWLRTGQDRRKVLGLILPDATLWTGGYRELVRRLLADPHWEPRRSTRLGESGIRGRLRRLSQLELADVHQVRGAFGF